MDQTDQEILRMSQDIAKTARLSKRYDPQTLDWSTGVPWDECMFSPGVRRRTRLILPLSLRTKLDAFEWNPLLAFDLIRYRSRTQDNLVPFFLVVVPVAAFSLAFGFVGLVLAIPSVLALLIIPILALSIVLSLRQAKRMLFKHLNEAASIAGRAPMVASLERIDSFGISEVEKGKRRKGLLGTLWPAPSIMQRIEYLRSLGSD